MFVNKWSIFKECIAVFHEKRCFWCEHEVISLLENESFLDNFSNPCASLMTELMVRWYEMIDFQGGNGCIASEKSGSFLENEPFCVINFPIGYTGFGETPLFIPWKRMTPYTRLMSIFRNISKHTYFRVSVSDFVFFQDNVATQLAYLGKQSHAPFEAQVLLTWWAALAS